MNIPYTPDHDLEKRLSARLLDVFIRAGLVLAMTMLCYRIFAPFLPLMLWALILAVTMYPIHRQLARRLGGKQGLAATLLVLVSIVLIVAPTSVLISSLGDSTYELFNNVKNNTLQIPAPSPSVADWPIVGKKVHSYWSQVHDGSAGSGSEACSQRSVNWQNIPSISLPAPEAKFCNSSSLSSLPESSWPSASRGPGLPRRFSSALSALTAAKDLPISQPRPFVQ